MANHANVQLNSAGQVVLRASGTIAAAVALGDPGDPCCCGTNACCTTWFTRFICTNNAWASPGTALTTTGTNHCTGGGTACCQAAATNWTTIHSGPGPSCLPDDCEYRMRGVLGATHSGGCSSFTCTASSAPAVPTDKPCCCPSCDPCSAGCGTNGYRIIINSTDNGISGTYDTSVCDNASRHCTPVNGWRGTTLANAELECRCICGSTAASSNAGCFEVNVSDSTDNPNGGTGIVNACLYHFVFSGPTSGANCTNCFVCPPEGTYVGDPDCAGACPTDNSSCGFGDCDFSATATVIKL